MSARPALGRSAEPAAVGTRPSYAYLGPRGSFTEIALLAMAQSDGADLVPAVSVPAALAAVRAGDVTGALVPMENSVEGTVPVTLDDLAQREPLVIVAEEPVPAAPSVLVDATGAEVRVRYRRATGAELTLSLIHISEPTRPY